MLGMHVLDALDAVCHASGFGFACLPLALVLAQLPNGTPKPEGLDRPYVLRIWRLATGPLTSLRLAPRGGFEGDPAADLPNNSVSSISGARDASGSVNTVSAVGRCYLQATVPLKPLWSPGEVWRGNDGGGLDTPEQLQTKPDPSLNLDSTDYWMRHVAHGGEHDAFGHVGRLWGVDCTGELADSLYDGNTPLYEHDPAGFAGWAFLPLPAPRWTSPAKTPVSPMRSSGRGGCGTRCL